MIVSNGILNFINDNTDGEFEPFYVYDSQMIRNHCRQFRDIPYAHKAIHFASMANVNQRFLQIVKDENLRVFVNSMSHLKAVADAGFSGEEIIFTSSALSKKLMKQAIDFGVQVNVDSPNQLKQWLELFPDTPVGIRCNIGDKVAAYSNHAGSFIGRESRLGFTLQEMKDIVDKSKIKGLHLYAGTDIFDIDYFRACYSELIAVADMFDDLEYLNFGGGFGVAENGSRAFDFEQYSLMVTELMTKFSENKKRNMRLIVEPGRIVGGEAGYFVCYVTDIKNRDDKQLVGLNASTVQFPRPLLYSDTAVHPVAVIRNGRLLVSDELKRTDIYGCSTYSRDIFAKNRSLPVLQIGDVVVLGNAGSYSASSYLHFLGFEKPKEFFV